MRSVLPARTSEFLITQKCPLACTYCFETCKSNKDIDFKMFIDSLYKDGKYSTIGTDHFYIFGGEPLMNMGFVEDLLNYIDNSETIGPDDKVEYINSITNNLITNGVLIDKYIDIIKKYNISLQISIDGPEDINDKYRVDHAGNGHFKDIMKNIELCRENDIRYTLHGVLSRENYGEFCRINEFFLEEALKNPRLVESKYFVHIFYKNYLQIVFEENITDEDIDIILEQFYKTVEMIMTTPLLKDFDYSVRREIAEGFLNRRGGICSAGFTMFSYDDDFNVFPCHRLNTSRESREANRLTTLLDEEAPFNYKYYEQFQEAPKRREMYSAYYDNTGYNDTNHYWLNWCPSTNWETSGNVFQIPSKHDTLVAELQVFLPKLARYFGLNILNPKFNEKAAKKTKTNNKKK